MVRYFFRSILLSMVSIGVYAQGVVTVIPTPVFDAPSSKARAKFIISGGHPLEQLSRIDGWRKVRTFTGDNGWVVEKDAKEGRFVVVKTNNTEVYVDPNVLSPVIFRVNRGVVLELFKTLSNGWVRVLHKDGESGYIQASEIWKNTK